MRTKVGTVLSPRGLQLWRDSGSVTVLKCISTEVQAERKLATETTLKDGHGIHHLFEEWVVSTSG